MKMLWLRLRRDKGALLGLFLIVLVLIMAIFAPLLAPYDPDMQNLSERRSPPSMEHIMGQDTYGRDIFSRILYGSRNTLMAGVVCVLLAGVTGSFLGLIAGFYNNKLSSLIMRSMDVILAYPYFLLAILIIAVLSPGLFNAILAVSITTIPSYARTVRSNTLVLKNSLFVEAARALGSSNRWIILKHILPNSMASIIVLSTVGVATAIISTAALSYIGLGAQPPSAEWGLMLSEARSYLTSAPHISIFPGVSIVLLVLGFNLFGDGLRDILDPRLK